MAFSHSENFTAAQLYTLRKCSYIYEKHPRISHLLKFSLSLMYIYIYIYIDIY